MEKDIKLKKSIKLNRTGDIVFTGLLFALALVLSIVENSLPPLLITVPGVKFGLSNIVIMFSLFFIRKRNAYAIAILKSAFVLLTRGALAGVLSLGGGMLSLIVMTLLLIIFKEKISYLMISVFGALFHNVGQMIVISLVFTNLYMWAYFPVLFITGIISGIVTSTLLKVVLPAFKKLSIIDINNSN